MSEARARAVGIALLALLAVHVAVNREGPWVLLAACDLAAAATGVGLACGWHRAVAVALVFQLSVGFPSFLVGVFTTYRPNVTSVGIHLLPLVAGGLAVRRRGLPRHAAVMAFAAFVVALLLSYALPPPEINVNLVRTVWPPLASVFPSKAAYAVVFLGAGPLLLLSLGESALRRALGRGPQS
jgi:hypothetical protein